jgi:hypothetical protein
LFRVCTRPSRCTQRPNLFGGPTGPDNAPRSRARPGLTTLLGAAAGRRPAGPAGRPSAPLGRRRTTSSEAAIPRPEAERKEAERPLLGGTRTQPSNQVIGRTRAPRSAGDVGDVPGSERASAVQSNCELARRRSAHRSRSSRPAATPGPARIHSTGTKTHGSIEQRSGGNAESLATDSLAAQSPEVDGSAKAPPKLVATPAEGERKPSPTARGPGPAATRGRRSERETLRRVSAIEDGRDRRPSSEERRARPETWRTPWPVAGCNRPARC